MYAVIRTGGKQYRVAPDEELQVEKIEAAEGERIEFSDVLMIGKDGEPVQVGKPVIEGARVAAEVVEQGRADKIIVFKKKRRKNYRRKNGHRQHLTTIRVLEVLGAGEKPKKKTAASAKAKPGEGVGSEPAEEKKAKAKAKTGATQEPPATQSAPAAEKPKKQPAQKKQAPAQAKGVKLLDAPEGESDNLKALPGVGAKLAEKLNGYGIFHFHQLAAMSEDDVKEMDAALSLRGRATRDDWVGQAKQLMEEKTS